jgi:hypothetical protein
MSKRAKAHKAEVKALRKRREQMRFDLQVIWLLARRDGFTRTVESYMDNVRLWGRPLPRAYKREMKRPKLRLVA